MKVFFSDLHLSDTYEPNEINYPLNFDLFLEDIEARYERQGRDSGLELIILGDFLDLLRPNVVDKAAHIENIFFNKPRNEKIIKALRRFSEKHSIIYVIGNHDRYLFNDDDGRMRKVIQRHIHIPDENFRICYYNEPLGIWAEHGNHYDMINRFVDFPLNLVPPLGEYFITDVIHKLKNIRGLEEIFTIRPLSALPDWLKYKKIDSRIWLTPYLELRKSAKFMQWYQLARPEQSSILNRLLFTLSGVKPVLSLVTDYYVGFRGIIEMVHDFKSAYHKTAQNIFTNNLEKHKPPYMEFLLPDPEQYKRLRVIVMGHTHFPDGRSFADSAHKNELKYYFNTGTWQMILEPAVRYLNSAERHEMLRRYELCYLVIYDYQDEIKRTELWNGVMI
jgi:UDP-2,3-diacylglucosamine pyrophosphatase LpxH